MLATAALGLMAGCVLRTDALRPPELPLQAKVDPERFLVITVRNDPPPVVTMPASTPRGYTAAGVYGVSPTARATARAVERDYRLREVSAWPIESLRVHCLVVRLPDHTPRSALMARLERDSRVESVEPLNEFSTEGDSGAGAGSDQQSPPPRKGSYAPLQVNLVELGVPQAQQLSRGAAVRIAIIDTGIDYQHPDLRGRIIAQRDFVTPAGPFTGDRHGTEVAGVIAATADDGRGVMGVAPESQLIALKACWPLRQNAARAVCNSFTLAQALESALAAHADIVNLSLAGPPDPLLARLIRYGMGRGIIYVGAVAPARGAAAPTFPVDIPGVLGVQSAEDAAGSGSPNLLAPGDGILTLVPGGHYDFASGSSLATAEVTGIVALIVANGRRLSGASVERILARSSRRLTTPRGILTSVNACTAVAVAVGRTDCRDTSAIVRSENSVKLDEPTVRRNRGAG